MQLVILAAGHGRRFGGLKQLAPVGPGGEAIMDYTAADALAAGFDGVVLVVRAEVSDELAEHTAKYWPGELEVVQVLQGPIAGTAQAVASVRSAVDGPFAVANADDLYGLEAIELLARQLAGLEEAEHLLVSYKLANTVITKAPVTRGLCRLDGAGWLEQVIEHSVARTAGGFRGRPLGSDPSAERAIGDDEPVSMNLWGFDQSIFDHLDAALAAFDPETAYHEPGKPPEVLLPVVVADILARGEARVRVSPVDARCIGLTHPDDLDLVRRLVATDRP